jgi:hypothetical protein
MNKFWQACFLTLSLLLTLNAASSAQDAPPDRRGDRRGPPPDWDRRPGPPPSFEMFADSKLVKGAPYSATAITEHVQTLADGARITRTQNAAIYRDSEGRTRREQTFDRVGPFSVGEQSRQIVFINDVVAGQRITLDPQKRSARKTAVRTGERPGPRMAPPPRPSDSERKTESLGKQMIEGVEAEGTRTTVTIPAGKIGNDRPLEIVSERWESPALQIVVLSRHKDPFAGETTYKLTNLKREEPPHSLFEVPSDYAVEESKPSRGPWDDRRKPPQQ